MDVIGLGSGGHAKVMIETLRLAGEHRCVGLLDLDERRWGQSVLGVPVLGGEEKLPELHAQGIRHGFVGIGAVTDPRRRRRAYDQLRQAGFEVVSAIHPRAVLSASARVGQGAAILANAVVHTEAVLGINVLVNTGAIVEHDCVIGDHVHIAPGALLSGGVQVGEETLIGVGASVREGMRLGRQVIVGAGAGVVSHVVDGMIVVGLPARVLRAIDP